MLFRRECSKINRGPSCRRSIGEFWCCMLFCHCEERRGRRMVGGNYAFLELVGGYVYRDLAGGGGRR